MKKIILLSSVIAMAVSGASADYRTIYTNNCHPAAMHAVLDEDVSRHHAVITEVICEEVVAQPVYAAPVEPVYYAPAPMEYIPVVDCIPGPTKCEYCGCC